MIYKKIIFPFAFLLLIISPCFLFTLKNKNDAEELKKMFDISSLEEIKNRYAQTETLATDAGVYTSICIPSTRKIFPNSIILIKMPSEKTRVFYAGYYFQHSFLSSLEEYANIIIDEDPEYIIEQKGILNFENAMEVALEIFSRNAHFSEL